MAAQINMFNTVTEKGSYVVGYLDDGWTKTISIKAKCPYEAMMRVQNAIGSICNVTFVERM